MDGVNGVGSTAPSSSVSREFLLLPLCFAGVIGTAAGAGSIEDASGVDARAD